MSSKLPKELKIGYATYKVKHVSRKSIEDAGAFGETDYNDSVISVFGNQEPSEAANTLLHECLHAVSYIFSIKFKNAREEERYVKQISNALTTIFKDNPELIRYFRDSLKEK